MTDRRVSLAAKWGGSVVACAALVLGGSGITSAQAAPRVKTASVDIPGYMFTPHTLKITRNTKVTWTNHDTTTGHTVVFADFGTKRTLLLNKTWSHKFTTDGTFSYHCSLHPEMTGKVVVTG
jgi:plastocyanin